MLISMEKISKHSVNVLIHDDVLSILKHKNVHLVKYVAFTIDHFVLFRSYVHLLKVGFWFYLQSLSSYFLEEKSNVDSLELRSVLAYLCLKPKLKCDWLIDKYWHVFLFVYMNLLILGFDKKPAITVLHQLIRNGNAFLRIKGQREHVSIIGKALKPPKTTNTLGMKSTNKIYVNYLKCFFEVQQNKPIGCYQNISRLCSVLHRQMLICVLHFHVDILMLKFF